MPIVLMRLIGIWAVICLTIGATSLHAGLVAPRSLLELEQHSDLIVVGSATATISIGSPKAMFPLEVSRVIKGD